MTHLPPTPSGRRAVPSRLWLAAGLVTIAVAVVWHFQLGIDDVKAVVDPLRAAQARSPLLFATVYLVGHIVLACLCIPVEILLAITAGALFGPVQGTILASFGSSIGGTLSFLWSRRLLRDRVRAWFPRQAVLVDQGVERDGILYLITLRLLPVFPFFLVNLLSGLTPMRARTFYLVTQLSLLPAICLYANAGTQLARIDSVADILSPGLIAALTLLAVFPWVAKWGVAALKVFRTRRKP